MGSSRKTKPAPKPAAMVGVDIGSDLIKVAEAKYGKDGITITGLGVARIPEGVVENEVIVNPKALGDAIKALLSEAGIKTKKVVSSVSGQSRVVVRVIEVPKMNGKELAETMKWEVERHVPFAPNEVVMDFQPLDNPGADPDAQNMEVLLAVAQQELVYRHVEALQAAGLKPIAIDIEPLAASRALTQSTAGLNPNDVVAIVNIGCNNTDLSIFEDGILTFPSPPLGIAGTTFTQEIAEAMGQTLEQAEVTKKEYAAVDLDGFDNAGVISGTGGFGQPSEPTSFGTSFAPSADAGFDLGAASAPAASDPAQPGGFMNTVDGPVFDADPLSFDIGATAAPAAAAFDFGAAAEPEAPKAVFDFGSGDSMADTAPSEPKAQHVAPTFDLDDDEPQPSMEPENVEPAFDLSDAKEGKDPGDQHDVPDLEIHETDEVRKKVKTAFSEQEQQVFNAISATLMDLATELRRSLEYYSTKYSKVPRKIYLCGGTAKLPNLDKFLSNELGIPVEVADPVRRMKVNVPAASPPYLKEISPLVSVSIGLAVRDMIG